MKGRYLELFDYSTIIVKRALECASLCLSDLDNCSSFNYNTATGECELNSGNHIATWNGLLPNLNNPQVIVDIDQWLYGYIPAKCL